MRKRPAAQAAILEEAVEDARVALVELQAALHVPELANVEVLSVDHSPTEEDVRRSLREALPDDYPTTLILEPELLVDIGRDDRCLRLLHLQELRIVRIDALRQYDPEAGTDAADAHDLSRGIDDPIARQQHAPVDRQGLNIVLQQWAYPPPFPSRARSPLPWEWDLKRLAASAAVAVRFMGGDRVTAEGAARSIVRSYRKRMRRYAEMGYLQIWYERIDGRGAVPSG